MNLPLEESAAAKPALTPDTSDPSDGTDAADLSHPQRPGQVMPHTSPGRVGTGPGGAGWQQPSLPTLFKQLNSSQRGLTAREAGERLARFGPNEPAPARRRPLLVQVRLLFTNPLVGILLFASLVSIIVGDEINAGIILVKDGRPAPECLRRTPS